MARRRRTSDRDAFDFIRGFFEQFIPPPPGQNQNHQQQQTAKPAGGPLNKEEATLYNEVIRAGFKTLTAKYHPDRAGGDHEKMTRLNMLREKLEKVSGLRI